MAGFLIAECGTLECEIRIAESRKQLILSSAIRISQTKVFTIPQFVMNPINKLIAPRFPATAIGINSGNATMVQLERVGRELFALKKAATITLPETLVQPGFDEQNIMDGSELADALAELVTSAGLLKQRRWSVALPEASARTTIVTMERATGSRKEQEEVLRWKTERGFGVPLEELRTAREKLPADAQGRTRYIVTAVRLSVLEEYEAVFASLGWRAGLILPRHLGEARWLMRGKRRGDALLVSSHAEGFTAVLLHESRPIIVRSIVCEPEDRSNELYRLLLFYRDRMVAAPEIAGSQTIEHLMVVGDNGFSADHVVDVINETLGVQVNAMGPESVGLSLPRGEITFNTIAAPAGLATLAWN
jgi:hypothetical protein